MLLRHKTYAVIIKIIRRYIKIYEVEVENEKT